MIDDALLKGNCYWWKLIFIALGHMSLAACNIIVWWLTFTILKRVGVQGNLWTDFCDVTLSSCAMVSSPKYSVHPSFFSLDSGRWVREPCWQHSHENSQMRRHQGWVVVCSHKSKTSTLSSKCTIITPKSKRDFS